MVKELHREIAQCGSVAELQERLKAMPSELGGPSGLFRVIIERRDVRYQAYMAGLLLLLLEGDLLLQDLCFLSADGAHEIFVSC